MVTVKVLPEFWACPFPVNIPRVKPDVVTLYADVTIGVVVDPAVET
jgi:hypothetical protein